MSRKPFKIAQEPAPFAGNAQYLEQEAAFLKLRVARLAEEKRAKEAEAEECGGDPAHVGRAGRVGSREARCRVVELREMEQELRRNIDARLALHRADPSRPVLGLDCVCSQHSLSDAERLVLIALAIAALGRTVCDDILGSLPDFYSSLSVCNAAHILDPVDLGGWLTHRKLFHPGAPLVRSGLVKVNLIRVEAGPADFMTAEVYVTAAALGAIVGDPELAVEGTDVDGDSRLGGRRN